MRYRFRRGTTELEMEFTGDVPEDQMKVVQELLAQFSTMLHSSAPVEEPDVPTPTVVAHAPATRKSRRGGKRTAFVSPEIDKLIETKWLVEKTTDDIVKKLRTNGVVAASEGNVIAALSRKVPQKLARVERDGVSLWTVHTTGG